MNSGLMKHQYAYTILTRPGPHAACYYITVFTRRHPRPGRFRERAGEGAVTNVAGAICIGQVVALYMTTTGGVPH